MSFKKYTHQDRIEYPSPLSKTAILDWLLSSEQYWIRKFLIALRSEEYYTSIKPCKLRQYWWKRKKNRLGVKLGIFIPAGCFGPGLKISHYGSIIVNPKARIGSNCTIHGNCCIGNSHEDAPEEAPVIGNNVNIGQGAQILGFISIASDSVIGAGAVVVDSITEDHSIAVGVPAKVIKVL